MAQIGPVALDLIAGAMVMAVARIAKCEADDATHWTVNPAVHTKFAQRAAEAERGMRDRELIAEAFAPGGPEMRFVISLARA